MRLFSGGVWWCCWLMRLFSGGIEWSLVRFLGGIG